MTERKKRWMVKRYFFRPDFRYPVGLTSAGILLLVQELNTFGAAITLGGFIMLVASLAAIASAANTKQIDSWFREDISNLNSQALKRLGLEELDLLGDPVVITGPIFWLRPGIPIKELKWRRGRGRIARFSVHRVTIIYLTEHFLNAYCCDFNFLRNVALNEQYSQYHYKDVVAISMGELSQSFTLATGEKLVNAQGFCLSFSSGENISVTVSAQELKDITNSEISTTEVENAFRTIKVMLKAKM